MNEDNYFWESRWSVGRSVGPIIITFASFFSGAQDRTSADRTKTGIDLCNELWADERLLCRPLRVVKLATEPQTTHTHTGPEYQRCRER